LAPDLSGAFFVSNTNEEVKSRVNQPTQLNSSSDKFGKPAQGHFLQPCLERRRDAHVHTLGCDPADLRCAYCDHPTVSLLRLDVTDSRLELDLMPVEQLPLVVCREHFLADFQYAFTSVGEPLLLRSDQTEMIPYASGALLVETKSQPVSLHAIPDRISETRRLAQEGRIDEAAEWAKRFEWAEPQNQVGGQPVRLARSADDPTCSLCDQLMPFFASIVVRVGGIGLNDGGFGQMLYFLCRTCACVAVSPDFKADNYS
jgi:hypothetical protein